MKKSTKTVLAISAVGILSTAAIVGITSAVKKNPSNSLEQPSFGGSNNIQTASPFSFATYQLKQTQVSAKPIANRESPVRITKNFKSGWVKAGINSNDQVYQSSEYYNQRDFMPILNNTWKMRNYANERDTGAVLYNRYYGWTGSEANEKTYYNKKGKVLPLSEYKNHALTYVTYEATQELKEFVQENNLTLKQDLIRMVMLDCNLFNKNDNSTEINKYLQHAVDAGIKFITIKAPTQEQLENIIVPTGVQKLTILDHDTWNFNKSQLESLRGIVIPSTVQELEFYSSTCKKVDPLILSNKTHMIYDHINDINNYYINQANFETIDLSKHQELSDDDLQKAIDTVYGERQFERAFHGYFVGGYISNLDLTNTGVTTLNNVVIPSQSDGRFNIAYVKWTGNSGSGTSSIIINDSKQPSNDSLVGEWYDPTNSTQNVTKLVVRTIRSVTVEDAAKEILGQIKRYPNIEKVDVKGVWLQTGTFDELEKLVNDALVSEDGTPSKVIEFIKE